MAAATREPTKADLGRLASFAKDLYVRCEFARMDAEEPGEPDWRPVRRRMTEMVAELLQQQIENGNLLDAAEDLVHPGWGCCCGLRFLSVASDYLDPSDVRRLEALSQSKEAADEFARMVAEISLALQHEND